MIGMRTAECWALQGLTTAWTLLMSYSFIGAAASPDSSRLSLMKRLLVESFRERKHF